MKTFPRTLAGAVTLAALLMSGCESNPDHSHPRTVQTVEMRADRALPDVEIEVTTGIEVVLPGPNPESGLVWEIVAVNSRVLGQTSLLHVVPGAAGAQPTTHVSFYALKPGRSRLRFFLVHPNQEETSPVEACEATISVSD